MPLAIELAAARVARAVRRADRGPAGATGSSCWPRATGPPRRASRPCGRPWTGATSCSPSPSRPCCAGCRCSPAGTWRWPSRSAPTRRSRPSQVLDLLAALIDKSLVTLDAELDGFARYRLLDTIKEYAADRLDASGEGPAMRLRHRDYLLRLAREHRGPGVRARRPALAGAGRACTSGSRSSGRTAGPPCPPAWSAATPERGPAAVLGAAQPLGRPTATSPRASIWFDRSWAWPARSRPRSGPGP